MPELANPTDSTLAAGADDTPTTASLSKVGEWWAPAGMPVVFGLIDAK
jgi:hypothetical protein